MEKEIFTEVLKELRKQKKMTQESLAEHALIDGKHFGRIERGENNPTLNTFSKICIALKISESDFFKLVDSKTKNMKG